MTRQMLITICLATTIVLATSATAQDALDRDTIGRWIEAAEDMQNWGEAQDEDAMEDDIFDVEAGAMPTFNDIEGVYAKIYRSDAEVRSMISDHGFDGAEQWGNISARITMGMVAMEMEETEPEMEAEMARAMKEMENNPDMPPQMREQMRQHMEQARAGMQGMTEGVREEDLPAIKAMRDELTRVLEVGDD